MKKQVPCKLNLAGILGFGGALSKFLHGRKAQRLLGTAFQGKAVDWAEGGCGYLAGALKRWAPAFVEKASLEGNNRMGMFDTSRTRRRRFVYHVVARVGPYAIDGTGVARPREVEQLWRSLYPGWDFRLVPYSPQRARHDVGQCDLKAYQDLAGAIQERFGTPEEWFCAQDRARMIMLRQPGKWKVVRM